MSEVSNFLCYHCFSNLSYTAGSTFETLTSVSNEAVVLAGLHGSFVTGNPRDDVLDMYLERVSLWQKIIELQRAELLSVKHQYVLKSHRSKFFANWEVYGTGSSQHYSNRQSRLDSGRFSFPGRFCVACFLVFIIF